MGYKRIKGESTKRYIARVLKAKRMLLGKSLAEVAEGGGITRQTASAIEDPTAPNTLNMIEAYLGEMGLEIELIETQKEELEAAQADR